MKNLIGIFTLLITITALAACGGKAIDEATKEAVIKTDSEWTGAFGEAAKWLASTQTEMESLSNGMKSMDERLSSLSPEIKAGAQADLDVCNASYSEMKTLRQAV